MATNGNRPRRPVIHDGEQLGTWYEVAGTTGLDDLRASADRCYSRTGQVQAIVRLSGAVELRPCPHDMPVERTVEGSDTTVTVCDRCDSPL